MLIEILNKQFQPIYILEKFESFIWTDRFNEYGDFEIEIPMEKEAFDNWIQIGNYIRNSESDRLMIIEQYKVFSDEEEGDHVQITGRSLESILERRVIMGKTTMKKQDGSSELVLNWDKMKFEDEPFSLVIEKLVRESFIDTVPDRKIDNFVIVPVTSGVMYETLITMEFEHDNLYDTVKDLCQTYWYGFKITLNSGNQFVFQLYSGEDRSFRQSRRPYVAFSANLDNLLSSEYTNSEIGVLNAAYCAGDDIGGEEDENGNVDESTKMMLHVTLGNTTGLERRETYEAVSGVNAESENAMGQVQMAGRIKMRESRGVCGFEGEADIMRGFLAYKDYFMGDIVEVVDRYGFHAATYITEIIISYDSDGLKIYPTFEYRDDLLRDYMEPLYLIQNGAIVSGSGMVNSVQNNLHGYSFEWSEDISQKLKYGTQSVNRNTGSGANLVVREVYHGPGAWGCIGSDKLMDLRNYSTLHVEFGDVALDFWDYRAFWQSTNIHITAAQEKKCGYTGFTRTICKNPTVYDWDNATNVSFTNNWGTISTDGYVDDEEYDDVEGHYTAIAVHPGEAYKITASAFDDDYPAIFLDIGPYRQFTNVRVMASGERQGFTDQVVVIPAGSSTMHLWINSYDSARYPIKIQKASVQSRKHYYALDVSDIDYAYLSVALYTWLQDKYNSYPAMTVQIKNMYLT